MNIIYADDSWIAYTNTNDRCGGIVEVAIKEAWGFVPSIVLEPTTDSTAWKEFALSVGSQLPDHIVESIIWPDDTVSIHAIAMDLLHEWCKRNPNPSFPARMWLTMKRERTAPEQRRLEFARFLVEHNYLTA